MDEFIKKVAFLRNRSTNKNIITYTVFLTPAEQQIVKNNWCDAKFFGGNGGQERCRAFFLPSYIDEIDITEYIKALRISFSFKTLSHRDFLGAILNLGIKRECVGDIYVFEKEAYVFITPELVDYIKINLTKVGSVGVVIEEVALKDVKLPELSFEEIKFTVQSLRLDSIASGIFRVSREKMSSIIKTGIVTLNYLVCDNVSKNIEINDIISIRGYGKAIISEIGGQSKSGKTFIIAKKYK